MVLGWVVSVHEKFTVSSDVSSSSACSLRTLWWVRSVVKNWILLLVHAKQELEPQKIVN